MERKAFIDPQGPQRTDCKAKRKMQGVFWRLYADSEGHSQSILSTFLIGRLFKMPKRMPKASRPITSTNRTLLNHTHAAALLVLLSCWSQCMPRHWKLFKPCQQSRTFAYFPIRHVEPWGLLKSVDCCDAVWTRYSTRSNLAVTRVQSMRQIRHFCIPLLQLL
jgi:hypothetical protein